VQIPPNPNVRPRRQPLYQPGQDTLWPLAQHSGRPGRWQVFLLLIVAVLVLALYWQVFPQREPELAIARVSGPGSPHSTGSEPDSVFKGQAQLLPTAEDAVRVTIREANAAFIAARARPAIDPLKSIAVGSWLAAEQATVTRLQQLGRSEHWHPVQITMTALQVTGSTATVCTQEVWVQTIVEPDGRSGPPALRRWEERYTLVLGPQRWLVSQIEVLAGACELDARP